MNEQQENMFQFSKLTINWLVNALVSTQQINK